MANETHPRCFCSVLPPHILTSIVERGSPDQRAAALRTLSTDSTFRAMRASFRATSLAIGAPPAMVFVAEAQKTRTISSAGNQQTLPGTVVRTEGSDTSGDVAVDEAYEGLGDTFEFLWEAYQRNSINDDGLPLDATVHYGVDYNNAFWDGQRMVFGDGDGDLFQRFTAAIDVIGHELAHGMTEDELGLVYMFQPGALNESISDVFGSLVKQKSLGQKAEDADWLIGAQLFGPTINGQALRSMKEPGSAYDDPILGKDPQPGHMKDYVNTWQDNGGVHINSGIPNKAFYLTATQLGGYAWERAGRIWYETLRDGRLRTNASFRRFARLSIDVAGRLYGAESTEQKAVRGGWLQVGISIA